MDNDISKDPLLKERQKEIKRTNRQLLVKSRADAYFNIYYEYGAERSLAKLHEYLGAVGVKISKTTLETYSKKFDWQVEVAKRDTQLNEIKRKVQNESILAMEERHIELSRAIQNIFAGGLKYYLEALKNNQLERIPLETITRSLKDAVAIERTARGEPVERRELQIHIMNMWIMTVTQIFISVNDYPTPQMRLTEFGTRLQQFVDQQTLDVKAEKL